MTTEESSTTSSKVKAVNQFFKTASKSDVDNVKGNILLTDRQETIFKMFYIQGKDVNFIADSLYISASVVSRELKAIRAKISPYL